MERFASGEYLATSMRGLQDKAAVERVSARVAALTGLDPAWCAACRPHRAEHVPARVPQGRGPVVSAYDTGVSSFDPNPTAAQSRLQDPVLDAMTAPLTSAILDHLGRTLNYKVDGRYNLLNGR